MVSRFPYNHEPSPTPNSSTSYLIFFNFDFRSISDTLENKLQRLIYCFLNYIFQSYSHQSISVKLAINLIFPIHILCKLFLNILQYDSNKSFSIHTTAFELLNGPHSSCPFTHGF